MLRLAVVLAACSGGTAESRGTSGVTVVAEAEDALVRDATMPDATPPDADVVAKPIPADADNNAWPSWTHEIVAVRPVGTGVEFTVTGGILDGIRRTWSASLIDHDLKPLPTKLSIVTVSRGSTVLRADVNPDQLENKRVRFKAPGE